MDSGASLAYTMEGTDAASFNFNATTRQITTKAGVIYDFETKFIYLVTIKVSDGIDSDTVAVTITLTDVNEMSSTPVSSGSLVSNLGQSTGGSNSGGVYDTGQEFTTGDNSAGYTLSSIEVRLHNVGPVTHTYPTVKVFRGSANGMEVTALTAPSTEGVNGHSNYTYTAPANVTLDAETSYWVVYEGGSNGGVSITSSTAEDATPASGWSIADKFQRRSASSTGSFTDFTDTTVAQIRVNGAIKSATPTNTAPTVANAIPDQTATEGAAFSYQFPDTTFNDVDTSDTLIYTATQADGTDLPTWLGFDAATRTFAGTPAATDVSVAVKVTATDTNNGTASDEFNIEVRAANVLHCNPSDPYELFCATLTVASNTSATDYGFAIGNYGSLSPDRFTYNGDTHRIGALNYSGSQLYFTTQQNDSSFATGFKLILDSVELSLDGAWVPDKVEYVVNNHGLSWSDNDTVEVKLVRLIPFSEKGPELDAPSRTEGWLQVRWGERAGATEVDATTKIIQAYNVEWRPVIRNYEGHTYGRVDKSAREHHLYNLESGTEYEVRVCELSGIEPAEPDFERGVCSRYSRIRMPGSGSARSNDVKVSIEFPEGGATKTLSTSDTVIRWRYRVTGIHNSGPEVSAHGVAAGHVVLQYRDETRQVTVFESDIYGTRAPLVQNQDSLGIRMDWLVFDQTSSGYVEREFPVEQSFRSTADRGPLMLYLLEYRDRGLVKTRLSPHGETWELCVEFEDAQGDVAVPCSSSQVEIDPPAVDGTPGVSGAGTDTQWSEGETVGVTVTFNEAVDVDTSGGTPSIGIGLGGTAARSATYTSGTGTTELIFKYTLVTGDGSHEFMAVTPNSLALNGGTIDSADSAVAALLTHNGALTSGNTGNTQRSTAPAVTFADVPADHDGETAFTVNIQFSGAPTGLSAKRDAASILEVTGGSVTGARATTKGERPVWEVTVAPDGVSDVTVRIPARACAEANAVCIGGQALAEAVEAVVPGAPITASFTQAPAAHDGASQFLLHMEFSHEPKRFSYRTVQSGLFDIEGGSIEKVRRRVKGSNLQWEITIAPQGNDAVTLTARATTDCTAQNAACDTHGRKFAGGLTLMVPGPATLAEQTLPAVSIAPPAQTAVEGATLAFALTRTGATDEALTVAVQVTETGSVLDGEPPASVTFAAGSTSATLSIATVDDETVEDAGTVTAAVSAGTDYEVSGTSGSAEAVVEDDDAAPVVGTVSPLVVAENATAVATLVATDADTTDLTWSIPQGTDGGADAAQFALTADGVLSFGTAKDFEAPDDADGDGDYEVTVRVTDGANPVDAALVVQLQDTDDAPPTLTSASVDGDQLTLTFSEALDEGSVPPASSFAVTAADSDNPVDEAAVSGETIVLTLSTAVTSVETVTVGYTVPTATDATPVQDTAGNRAATVADTQATNETPAALPTVSIAPVSTPVTEGTAAAFVLTRTGAVTAELTVTVQVTQAGSVLDGTRPSTATFASGASETQITVATQNDAINEADAQVNATVVAGDGYEVDANNARAGVDVYDNDEAAQAVEELWSTTLTWSDLGNNWFGGFADGFSNPGWSEDGQAFSIWYISYDAGSRTLRMAHDGSGGIIADPEQLSLHIGELQVGSGDALEAFAGARVGRTADVDAKWSVGEQVTVRLTRASGDAVASPAGPGFEVADAQVNEASGAPLQFRVTLDAPAQSVVSVRYGTANGTATAGQDYVAARGALRFAPGETAKTVTVAVLPDDHDEGSETMTLTLSAPFGATITDSAATGTISNTGAIPQAWIARFGRTVADQVLEAVQGRMRAAPAPGVEVSLAGQQIAVGSGAGTGEQAASGEDARQEEEARRDALRVAEWLQRETEGGERQGGSWALAPRDLLTSSSFTLTEETPGKDLASLWGRAAVTRFDGREGDLTLDGEVVTGMLGADWTRGRWAAGLILSHSTDEGGYAGAPADTNGTSGTGGRVEATLTGLFPWARHTLSGRLEAWGAAGYGAGELTVTPKRPGTDKNPGSGSGAGGAAIRADLDLRMAAAGLRGTLLDGGGDGLTLTGKTDALIVETASGRGTGADGGNLEAAQAMVTRLRLGVEASHPLQLGDGGTTLTPSLEVGLRHDGGDAETGFGLDLGAGLRLSDPIRGLEVEIRGRGLLSHESEGFRERGFSGALSWRQNPSSERGAMLTLTQTVGGSSSGGADALLSRTTLDGLAANPGSGSPGSGSGAGGTGDSGDDELKSQRLELKFGYGLPAFGDRYTWTPEAYIGLSDTGRDYSLGWRLVRGGSGSGGGSLELSFLARRSESVNDDTQPVLGVGFTLTARF